ncbi:hypothetical protein H671_4g12555 [Cricetulus griseus]|nr:hypothetical protein H671_4g12555 [Cricetulus griseus]
MPEPSYTREERRLLHSGKLCVLCRKDTLGNYGQELDEITVNILMHLNKRQGYGGKKLTPEAKKRKSKAKPAFQFYEAFIIIVR